MVHWKKQNTLKGQNENQEEDLAVRKAKAA